MQKPNTPPLRDPAVDTGWHRMGRALGALVSGAQRIRVPRSVRIVVSVGLLALLLYGVDWPTVLAHAAELSPAIATFVMVGFAVQLGVSSWKWQWALRIHGLHFSYPFLTRVLVIGFFLNNFLPTSIGGDAYRVFRTMPETAPRSRALSAVLLERLVGVSALMLLGFAGALVLYSTSELARTYVIVAGCCLAGAIGIVALISLRSADWRVSRAWIPLVAISLLFQAQAIIILYELFHALDANVGLAHAALIAAAAGIAAVIPFSINGLGIVEATIAGTAVAVGVSYEAGLLVALLMRILLIPMTLLAGLVYAFEPAQSRHISNSLSR